MAKKEKKITLKKHDYLILKEEKAILDTPSLARDKYQRFVISIFIFFALINAVTDTFLMQ